MTDPTHPETHPTPSTTSTTSPATEPAAVAPPVQLSVWLTGQQPSRVYRSGRYVQAGRFRGAYRVSCTEPGGIRTPESTELLEWAWSRRYSKARSSRAARTRS